MLNLLQKPEKTASRRPETGTESGSALFNLVASSGVLNSLADGAYITDLNRRILFWSRAAERITGWSSAEVLSRTCSDNILVHVDKDGRPLCGRELCPLHRTMVTGLPSTEPLLIFGKHRRGGRIPLETTVAPIRDKNGDVIGGIETFRDLTSSVRDQLQSRSIQRQAFRNAATGDDRISCQARYMPRDIIGGDFYGIERVDADHYGLLVADAMGHGISAALYSMQLRAFLNECCTHLETPSQFMKILNQRLHELVRDAGYFGTGVCVNYNAATGEVRCVSAGHPSPLLFRGNGTVESLDCPNPPLGMSADENYDTVTSQLQVGDALLLFTDGATEILDSAKAGLGADGLECLVRDQSDHEDILEFSLELLETQLLKHSDQIRLQDDLTLVKIGRLR